MMVVMILWVNLPTAGQESVALGGHGLCHGSLGSMQL